MAWCQIKLKMYQDALESCDTVLNYDPNNVKALFRKGQTLMLQHEYLEAKNFFIQAARLSKDKSIRDALTDCKEKIIQMQKKEKKVYSNMLSKEVYDDKQALIKKSKFPFSTTQMILGGTAIAIAALAIGLKIFDKINFF